MRLIFVLLVLLTTGCYSYVPLDAGQVQPESRVRAYLSEVGSRELAIALGQGVQAVDGIVYRIEADTLGVAVRSVLTRQNFEQYWNGEGVSVPASMVVRLEERRFSKMRSALLAGGLVVGSYLLRSLVDFTDGKETGSIPIGPPVKQ